MRHLIVLLLVFACKDQPPRAPDPAKFAAMTAEAKCAATAPRASSCIDEVMIRQMENLRGSGLDKETVDALANDLRGDKATADQAEQIHRVSCSASDAYPEAVFACWSKPDCKTFADCVVEKDVILRR